MAQTITNEIVLEAARDYVKTELGIKKYRNNPEAAKAVGTDFIRGIKWTLRMIRKDEEIIDMVDPDLEFEK